MNDEKEKWLEDVFQSMKGSQRAKPQFDLFAKIENKIHTPEAKVISVLQLRIAAVAAIFLIVFNVSALYKQAEIEELTVYKIVETEVSNQVLFSNYNIYE